MSPFAISSAACADRSNSSLDSVSSMSVSMLPSVLSLFIVTSSAIESAVYMKSLLRVEKEGHDLSESTVCDSASRNSMELVTFIAISRQRSGNGSCHVLFGSFLNCRRATISGLRQQKVGGIGKKVSPPPPSTCTGYNLSGQTMSGPTQNNPGAWVGKGERYPHSYVPDMRRTGPLRGLVPLFSPTSSGQLFRGHDGN